MLKDNAVFMNVCWMDGWVKWKYGFKPPGSQSCSERNSPSFPRNTQFTQMNSTNMSKFSYSHSRHSFFYFFKPFIEEKCIAV